MSTKKKFSRLFLSLITEKEKRLKSKTLKENVQFNLDDKKLVLLFINLFDDGVE